MLGNYCKYDNMYTHNMLYDEAVKRGLMENYREEFEYLYWMWYFHSSLLFAVQAGQFYSREEFVAMQKLTRSKISNLRHNTYFKRDYKELPQLADLLYCDGEKMDMDDLFDIYKEMLEQLYS